MAKSSFTQRPSFSAAKSRTGKRSGPMRGFFALRHSRDEIAARWNVRGSAAVTIAIVICAITWGMVSGPLAWHRVRVSYG